METAPPQPENPDTNTPSVDPNNEFPIEPAPVELPKRKIWPILIVAAIFIIICAGIAIYYFNFRKSPQQGAVTNVAEPKLPKTFINCDDPRQVLEEANLLYVGCLGGVLVVDKTTGEVKDQIGTPDGLASSLGGSLVKKGDILYIGGQDGLTIFNLKTRQAQKVSVKEGLVNGANILLFEDGENIWVATFNGVSLLNTVNNSLTNFTTELDPNSQNRNVRNMYLTKKYVYFLEVASSLSSGAIARYNRQDKTFKVFTPADFGRTDQYARTDFFTVGGFGSQVFIAEGNTTFSIDENGDDTWKEVKEPYDFVRKDNNLAYNSSLQILQNPDPKGVLFWSENKIYRYIPSTDTSEMVYDFGKNYSGILSQNSGSKIWFKPPSDSGNFLSSLGLDDLKVSNYTLAGRPVNFSQLVAVIDNDAIFDTPTGVFKYSIPQNKFERLLVNSPVSPGSFLPMIFLPIPGTSNILILSQECGQGCSKPVAQIYDYTTGISTEITIPDNILSATSQKVEGGAIFQTFDLIWRDNETGDIGIATLNSGNEKYVVYNVSSGNWRETNTIPQGADNFGTQNGVVCNKVYTLLTNNNKFSSDGCTGRAENEKFSWEYKDQKLIETDKTTKVAKILNPPTLTEVYTPFGTMGKPRFGGILYSEGLLWITSDRGLITYNPSSGLYHIYGPSDGLLNQDVTNFFVGKYLWVNMNWGGFSILPLKEF